jgi:CBS domain-containing protein
MLTMELPLAAEAEPSEAPIPSICHRAEELARRAVTLTPAQLNRDVMDLFRDHPAQASLPVVEDGVAIGLLNRTIFLTGFSMPFRREVYERKSCIAFMDKTPLVVDADLSLADLGRLVVDAGSKVLQDGFIVTRNGCFQGLGSGMDLLRALGQLEAERNRVIRESIDYARIIQGAVQGTSLTQLADAALADQRLRRGRAHPRGTGHHAHARAPRALPRHREHRRRPVPARGDLRADARRRQPLRGQAPGARPGGGRVNHPQMPRFKIQ